MNLTKVIGVFLGVGALLFGSVAIQGRVEQFFFIRMASPLLDMVYAKEPPAAPKPEINANAALSARINFAGRKRIIFSKDAGKKLAIASLTKLMTALVVLEDSNNYQLGRRVVISAAAASQDDVPILGNLKPGEIYTIRELLGLMMYYSSNDAAYALAEVVGVDKFVGLMNGRASELGLSDTQFGNANGLDNGGEHNTSSARDLFALTQYIIKNQAGIFVFSMTPGALANENGIFSVNLPADKILVGGKTGFTNAAGGCMLLVFRDLKNNYYFNVVLGSASAEDRVAQMQKLVNYDNLD